MYDLLPILVLILPQPIQWSSSERCTWSRVLHSLNADTQLFSVSVGVGVGDVSHKSSGDEFVVFVVLRVKHNLQPSSSVCSGITHPLKPTTSFAMSNATKGYKANTPAPFRYACEFDVCSCWQPKQVNSMFDGDSSMMVVAIDDEGDAIGAAAISTVSSNAIVSSNTCLERFSV